MNREFLEFYNRELALLREQASEFAQEYPGVAERLGGLLEGSAFLAARVQLKIKHEFAEFTTNLLDQLVPHYLAPTPSALLAQVQPKFGDPALREGRTIPRGSYLDAATDLSALPEVRSSILNFGFPDLSWRTIDENGLHDVAGEIEVALLDFEPRLARDSVPVSYTHLTLPTKA